jgi:hypothetical protein
VKKHFHFIFILILTNFDKFLYTRDCVLKEILLLKFHITFSSAIHEAMASQFLEIEGKLRTVEELSIMKNAVFWDVTPCGSCKNRRFGGMCLLHLHGDRIQRAINNVSSNYQSKHTTTKCHVKTSNVTTE